MFKKIALILFLLIAVTSNTGVSASGITENSLFLDYVEASLRANNVEWKQIPLTKTDEFTDYAYDLNPNGEKYSVLTFSADSAGIIQVASVGLDFNSKLARRNGTVAIITVLKLMGLSDNEIETLMAPGKDKTSVICKKTKKKVYLEGSVDKTEPIVYMIVYCD